MKRILLSLAAISLAALVIVGIVEGQAGFVLSNGMRADGQQRIIIAPFSYSKITTNASTQIKSSTGTLGKLIVSGPGSAWTIQVFDNTSCAAPAIFGATAVTVPAASTSLDFNLDFSTGLCVLTAGTTPGEITVTWR